MRLTDEGYKRGVDSLCDTVDICWFFQHKIIFTQRCMHYLMTDDMHPGVNTALSICLQFNVTFGKKKSLIIMLNCSARSWKSWLCTQRFKEESNVKISIVTCMHKYQKTASRIKYILYTLLIMRWKCDPCSPINHRQNMLFVAAFLQLLNFLYI